MNSTRTAATALALAMLSSDPVLNRLCRNPEPGQPVGNGSYHSKGRYRETTAQDHRAFQKRVAKRRAKKGYS